MSRIESLIQSIVITFYVMLCLLTCQLQCHAQLSSASLSISVVDTSGAAIPSAAVTLRSIDTNQEQHVMSGRTGTAAFSFIKPGRYDLTVSKEQFAEISVSDIVLNVGDNKHLQISLKVGADSQVVTVDGSGLTINTSDGAVSTVIDQKFVENTPLNGRSFQSLILLTPGTNTNTPQRSSGLGASGEFSVNGQRTESNYYTVDGVSANIGSNGVAIGAGPSGSVASATALGTTQALVSVDALQEFRVDSSTYSAEYGRNPGGQFAMVSRSGTDRIHGTAFDYFRNDALDSNNWFNDNAVPRIKKTPEHQNDFGGTLGGPIFIPDLYDGRARSFFFMSYEGLRLIQPIGATLNPVPSNALRQATTGTMAEVLNAFPKPNSSTDLGNGLSQFTAAWSNPAQIDATSVRIDHGLGQRMHLFFRFSNTPSNNASRETSSGDQAGSPSVVTSSHLSAQSYTLGTNFAFQQDFINDLRVNYSKSTDETLDSLDNFGGATPQNLQQLQGIPQHGSALTFALSFAAYQPELQAAHYQGSQAQWNIVDTLSYVHGKDMLKFGVDWRRLPSTIPAINPFAEYLFTNATDVLANSVSEGIAENIAPAYPVYSNFSAFVQNEWRASEHLAVSSGVRWDVNPAPGVTRGSSPYTVTELSDYTTMRLAPQGTPLWNTAFFNFAPRLGIAYNVRPTSSRQTILRGGIGVFFDTGQQTGSEGFEGPGFSAETEFGHLLGTPATFPAPVSVVSPQIPSPPTSPFPYVYVSPAHLQLPYTLEWNISIEQSLDRTQSFTISYVGANGRRLLEEAFSNIQAFNPNFQYLYVFKNGLTSSYNALQLKYQRQVSHGLQALASYTWAHSLDFGSYNSSFAYIRGKTQTRT